MKKTFTLTLLLFITSYLYCQSFYYEYGFNRTRTFLDQPLEYSYNNFEDQDKSWCLGYEQCVLKTPQILISFDYTKNTSLPTFVIRNPETAFGGFGIGITFNKAFALGLKHELSFFNKRMSLGSGLHFKVLKLYRTDLDSTKRYNGGKEDYPYSGVFYPIAYRGTYFVPEIRLSLGVQFLWRMHFYINAAYAHGFSRTQDVIWEYSYKGVPRPKAVGYVNGTELRFHLGLKFDIVRCKKKEIEKKTGTYQKKKRKYK